MKNYGWVFCIFGLLALSFTSCSKTNDEEWRDKNLQFFDNLKGSPNVLEVGDSINGYAGLFYTVEHVGTGPKPVIGNYVKVIYAGYTLNDTLKYNSPLDINDAFDYNKKGAIFKVGKTTIEGFSLALQSMPVGSHWRVYLPYYLAYGTSGTSTIKPYSTLIFDMTLVSIESDN